MELLRSPSGLFGVAPDVLLHWLLGATGHVVCETDCDQEVLIYGVNKNILSKGTAASSERTEDAGDELVGVVDFGRRKHWVLKV